MTDSAHIAEETLERYALGTLGDEERRSVDEHAAGCAPCREALRREALLAAGVRMAGRADLKRSLGRRIAALDRPRRAWRALAVAASLAIVIGGGLYVAWLEERGPAGAVPAPVAGNVTAPTGSARRDEAPQSERSITASAPSHGTNVSGGRPAVKSAHQPEDAEFGKPREITADKVRPLASAHNEESGYWTEGVVEEAPSNAPGLEESGAARAQSAGAFKKEALELKGNVSKDDIAGERQGFLLRQQPAGLLPAEAGAKQRQHDGARVPAHVEQRGATTTMTLYLDTLVDEGVLRDASVRQAGRDSVIVEIGKRKILYRLPGGAAGQQQNK